MSPFTFVLPSLNSAQKQALAMLESLLIGTFVEIPVAPLSDAYSVRESVVKIANIYFAFSKSQFTEAFHNSCVPTSSVSLLKSEFLVFFFSRLFLLFLGPVLFPMAMRSSSRYFTLI
jgi:hypothetical protein